MKNKIIETNKDPLGTMMLDYIDGMHGAYVDVESSTLDMWEMSGEVMFRTFKNMLPIERKALAMCHGEILDIGAGSGCHSLYLQNKGCSVDALDLSIGCVEVMKKRKVEHIIHDNIFSLKDKKYDTLLMLMNGIGICGSIDGLNMFLQFAGSIFSDHGQILADSTDLTTLHDSALAKEVLSETDDCYHGETQFIMSYKNIQGDPFDWIYVDFETLEYHAERHGFSCEKILADKTGKYLARLSLY
jgi:SAM-dependent methyltransferase